MGVTDPTDPTDRSDRSDPFSRILKYPFFTRLLKKVQMQGGARKAE
jgi:hypothetical protein